MKVNASVYCLSGVEMGFMKAAMKECKRKALFTCELSTIVVSVEICHISLGISTFIVVTNDNEIKLMLQCMVAHMRQCFVFVLETALIILGCFSCC